MLSYGMPELWILGRFSWKVRMFEPVSISDLLQTLKCIVSVESWWYWKSWKLFRQLLYGTASIDLTHLMPRKSEYNSTERGIGPDLPVQLQGVLRIYASCWHHVISTLLEWLGLHKDFTHTICLIWQWRDSVSEILYFHLCICHRVCFVMCT